MSAHRPVLMIRSLAAQQVTEFPQLMALLGAPMQSDPENPEEQIPISVANVAEYFKEFSDHLSAVQETVVRSPGQKTIMFPDGYTEEFLFAYIMADRIPGADAKQKQENREALKLIFDQMTAASGASGLLRYLATNDEQVAYIRLIEEGGL